MPITLKRGAIAAGKVRAGMVGPSGGSAAIPKEVTTWVDPGNSSSITHVSNAVSAWRSQIGSTSFDQATEANKPTRVASGGGPLNGRQHLDFNGTTHYLNLIGTKLCDGQAGEVWFVVDADVTTGSQAVYGQVSGGATPYDVFYAMQAATKPGCSIHDATPNTFRSTNTFSADTTLLVRVYSTGSAYGLEINGTLETLSFATGSDNGRWFADHASNNSNSIGSYLSSGTPTQFLNGQLGDIIWCDSGALSTQAATMIRQYLAKKYGVTLP